MQRENLLLGQAHGRALTGNQLEMDDIELVVFRQVSVSSGGPFFPSTYTLASYL